ncbi:MAG: DoxX family protein [Siculibacillus sp.]|nr:DoxX family protein [Siculibacillus sp.]
MTIDEISPAPTRADALIRLLALPQRLVARLGESARDVALLTTRVALAVPFFLSGSTKWDGFGRLSDGAIFLFTEEFRLHVFGQEIAYPFPTLMAALAGTAEIVLPILLVVGLATRWAALGLLIMTGVIQITIPDGWANFHLPWAAMAAMLVVFGGGRAAVDVVFVGVRTRN